MRALAAMALIAGCYTGAPPPATPAPEPEAPPAHERTAADPLGFLPADADVIAHIDVSPLRGTPLWSRVEPALMDKAAPVLAQFKRVCGFDPIPQIAHVAIAMRGLSTSQLEGVVVIGGLSRSLLMGCMTRAIKQQPNLARIERGVVLMREDAGDRPVAFAFADARTMVVLVGARAATARSVRDVLAAGAPVRGNTLFMDLYNGVGTPPHAWMYMSGASKLFEGVATLGFHPRAVFGTIDAPAGASARVDVRMPDAAEATRLVTALKGQFTAVQSLVEKFEVTSDDDDVLVDIVLSEAQLVMGANLLGP